MMILNAFSNGVWIAEVSLLVVGTLALSFVLRWENSLPHAVSYAAATRLHKIRNAGIKTDKEWFIKLQERWEISEILLVALGAVCQQGCARDPSTSASRILYLSLLLMATLSLTAFSAVLTAEVSSQTPLCSTSVTVGKRSSLLPDVNKLPQSIVQPNFSRNADGNTVKVDAKRCQNTTTVPGGVNEMCSSASSRHTLIRHLRELESGLFRRRTDTTRWIGKSHCQEGDGVTLESQVLFLSVSQIWPAFAMLGMGLTAATMFFVAETAANKPGR